MRYVRLVLLIPALIAFSGCSYFFGDDGQFRERALDYQKASSVKPLSVPDDESRPIGQRYPIPEIGKGNFYEPKAGSSAPRPHALVNVDAESGIELRRDEDRRWLVMAGPVDRAKPKIEGFVNSAAFDLGDTQIVDGVLETGWLNPLPGKEKGFWKSLFSSSDKNKKERFQIKVIPSSDGLDSVVNINHVKVSMPVPEKVEWPKIPEDSERVALIYDALVDYLSEDKVEAGAAVLSRNLQVLPKHTMTRDGNDYPILVVNQDFNNAWGSVGRALKRAKFTINDINRTLGIYYLGLAEPQSIEIEDEMVEFTEVQLRLERSESGIQASVQFDDDNLAPKGSSESILTRLMEHL